MGAFYIEDEVHFAEMAALLTKAGGFPKGAQIMVVEEGGTKRMRTWKANDRISDAMVQRMSSPRTDSRGVKVEGSSVLAQTLNVRKVRRPRGLCEEGQDREGSVDPAPVDGVPTTYSELLELLTDLKGEGKLGEEWGISRKGGTSHPEFLWLGSRADSVASLQHVLDHLDVTVPPDKVTAQLARYTTDMKAPGVPKLNSRNQPVERSLEQSTSSESKFSQLELALSHRYAAEKAEAVFLDKATADNTRARREHLGEPDPGHSNLGLARRNDEICRQLGLVPPHSAWLPQLAADTGERFLFDYYANRFMTPAERSAAAQVLLEEVALVADDITSTADLDSDVPSQPIGGSTLDLDLEFAPFHYKKPAKLKHGEKVQKTVMLRAEMAVAYEAMDDPARVALFRFGGLDYHTCSQAKRQKILEWTPDVRSGYCIYDGPCYAAFPNLSINPSGLKRRPRIHKPECEHEQAQLIYEARFGRRGGARKRRRDGH